MPPLLDSHPRLPLGGWSAGLATEVRIRYETRRRRLRGLEVGGADILAAARCDVSLAVRRRAWMSEVDLVLRFRRRTRAQAPSPPLLPGRATAIPPVSRWAGDRCVQKPIMAPQIYQI